MTDINNPIIVNSLIFPHCIYFFFQKLKTNKNNLIETENDFSNLLESIKINLIKTSSCYQQYVGYFGFLFKMTSVIRDYEFGYGLRDIYYTLIYCWYRHFPEITFELIKHNFKYSICSWKDGKYLCSFIKYKTKYENHPLIVFIVNLMTSQLREDYNKIQLGDKNISFVAKWIPRQGSAYSWLFNKCAKSYYPFYIKDNLDSVQLYKAKNKCFSKFRKICSMLNYSIQPIEINQCQKKNVLNEMKLTSFNLVKYNKWLSNNLSLDQKENLLKNINIKDLKNEIYFKVIKLGLEYVRNNNNDHDKEEYINSLWNKVSNSIEPLIDILPIVDSSINMDEISIHKALGISILIAEKSNIGKKLIISNINYFLINLDECNGLISILKVINPYLFKVNSNLKDSFKSICSLMQSDEEYKKIRNKINILILSNLKAEICETENKINFLSNTFSFNKINIKTIFWVFDGLGCLESSVNKSIINIGNIYMINELWAKKFGCEHIILTSEMIFLKYITKLMKKDKFRLLDDHIIMRFFAPT